jgi:hypothetical protein
MTGSTCRNSSVALEACSQGEGKPQPEQWAALETAPMRRAEAPAGETRDAGETEDWARMLSWQTKT